MKDHCSFLTLALAFATAITPALPANELRTWMSRQGGTVEASLNSLRGDQVVLATADGRQVTLRTSDLSLADRQHLVEFSSAEKSILAGGDPGQPEKDLRIDSSLFETLPDKLALPGESAAEFTLLQTPHFLIATAGDIRPRIIAETAERLWHGMAFQHMNFRKDWGDKRALIFVVEDRSAYEALGRWNIANLTAINQVDAAQAAAAAWPRVGGTSIMLPDNLIEERGLLPNSRVFNVTDSNSFRRPMGSFVVHSISNSLLATQLGGIASFGAEGYFAITTGHAYYKEISLAGKSETNLLTVAGSQRDEISSQSGFEDGTSWARTLRQLVRRGTVVPDLAELFKWSSGELTPERLVLIYSFAYYMQSDAARLSSYAAMVRRIESSNQIPELIEIASLFGFETLEALQEDWVEFIKSTDFR